MNRSILATGAALVGAMLASQAQAHNVFTSMYAPAGYLYDLEMRVTHGCKGSPVTAVRIKIPENVMRVSVNNTRDWTVETKMRKLPKPIPGEGGTMISETVDEIIWSKPKTTIPALGYFEGFKFRAALPKTPGEIVFFKTINVCEKGDDKYVDLPAEPLKVGAEDFPKKLFAFMTATPGPAPFLILEKPARPQYPWDTEGARVAGGQ
jgi:uncharacterized protein YcnI